MNGHKTEVNNGGVMVSVTVLTYNHEKYIRQALDSILEQKADFPYEILVGDDASTDSTPEILKEYAERYPDRIRLTLRKKNIGASRNAYELLRSAKGKYLASCEGDDYWCDATKLQCQVDYLEEHPEMVGCVHPCLIVDENGTTQKQQKLEWIREKQVFTLDDFQGIYLPGQLATFVRRNIFLNPVCDSDSFYSLHPMIADRPSIVLYLLYGNIGRIERTMSCYRKVIKKNAGNLTSKCFAYNRNRIQEEYGLLSGMENCLNDRLGGRVRFEQRRKELFAEALFQWMRNGNRENLVTARSLLGDAPRKSAYIVFMPMHGMRKITKKIKNMLLKD